MLSLVAHTLAVGAVLLAYGMLVIGLPNIDDIEDSGRRFHAWMSVAKHLMTYGTGAWIVTFGLGVLALSMAETDAAADT